MSHHRVHAIRAFGWQLDYRPDGWLPLGVRDGQANGWHVLRLGRLGCITLGPITRAKAAPVTVTLEQDTTAYCAAVEQLTRDFDRIRWSTVKHGERTQARRDWMAQAEAMYARYGWEWPGPVPGTAWSPRTPARVWIVDQVADLNAPTLDEIRAGREIGGVEGVTWT